MTILQPTVSPTQSDVFKALRAFLLGVCASGTEVFQAQNNRVPEPHTGDFVVMSPLRDSRLATNEDDYIDSVFTGSIAGAVMTITAVQKGAIAVGSVMLGVNVATGTVVTAFGTGTGGVGTYTIDPTQTIPSQVLATGIAAHTQKVQVVVQLDVHGDNAFENARAISTLFRDDYGVSAIQAANAAVTPLHADEARQAPFTNGEQQYEWRWVIEATLQVDETVTVHAAQPFTDTVTVDVLNVQAST